MKIKILLSFLLSLPIVGANVWSQNNDSIFIEKLKLADAKMLNLDKTIGYKLANGQIVYDVFTTSISTEERLALGLSDIITIPLVEVKQLFRPLPQRGKLSFERAEIALVDSIYDVLLTQNTPFSSLVADFSTTKENIFLDLRGLPEELEQVLKEMAIGDISRPILAPQGIYMFEKVGEAQRQICSNRKLSIEEFQKILVLNGVMSLDSLGEQGEGTMSVASKHLVGKGQAPSAWTKEEEKHLKLLLAESIETRLRDSASYQKEINRRSDSLLLQLVYDERVKAVCDNDTLGFAQFYNERKESYQMDYTRFSGLIVKSKRKVIRQLERIFKDLPHEQWVVALNALQKDGKGKKIAYFYGDDFLKNNQLAAEYNALSSLSDKKKRKAQQRYFVNGTFTEVGKDSPYLDSILKKDYRDYIENQWVNYLLEEYRKRKKK